MWEAFSAFHICIACFSELFRRHVVERAVRTLAVILLPPACQSAPYIIECAEPACVEALVAQAPVETLDMAILHRPSCWMCTSPTFQSSDQASIRREVNSGPLSERRFSGRPRSPISRSSTRVTRPMPRLVSASSATHPRHKKPISAWRIRLWPAGGWEYRGRRLSRERGNSGRRSGSYLCHPPERKPAPGRVGRVK
jgi:hypothetical protein